jgi:general secretion pathway protein H
MTIVTSPVGRNSRGFTLVELILVLMILALASLVILPNIDKGLQDRELRQSALGLAALARELRSRALYLGEAQQLVVNLNQNYYRAAGSTEVKLPEQVTFGDVLGGEELDNDNRQFVFFPNGSNAGGSIGLSHGQNGASFSVRLEPLTGKVSVLRGAGP